MMANNTATYSGRLKHVERSSQPSGNSEWRTIIACFLALESTRDQDAEERRLRSIQNGWGRCARSSRSTRRGLGADYTSPRRGAQCSCDGIGRHCRVHGAGGSAKEKSSTLLFSECFQVLDPTWYEGKKIQARRVPTMDICPSTCFFVATPTLCRLRRTEGAIHASSVL